MTTHVGKAITLEGVSKSWGDSTALDGIDLEIPAGKFTAILGPSGCGKSTTLRVIAGLETATEGRLTIGGEDVTRLPPDRRQLSMVFQNYALFPHLTVAENIVFGLRVERLGNKEREARLAEVAELLELSPFLGRKPAELSGGQQQRVALGRAVISRRPVCLMDEPLSNLDARLRDEMRREIRALQKSLGFTMVYVTHDQTEAITMADQVVLMNDGRIEQVDCPREIYQRPATPFAARFIGTPPMNLLPAGVLKTCPAGVPGALHFGIRPEELRLSEAGPLEGRVKVSEFLGADTIVELTAGVHNLLAKLPGNRIFAPDEVLHLLMAPRDIHLFDTDSGTRVDDPALAVQLVGGAQ